jgi:sugar lactone lactonase YvrE
VHLWLTFFSNPQNLKNAKPPMRLTLILIGFLAAAPSWAASYYTTRPDDAKAVYLTHDSFPVHADGAADDSDALQAAIDKVPAGGGVVFVPEGRYRITKTIYIWPSIRLIGYGASRPVVVLGANTPGFQNVDDERFLIFFAGSRPGSGRGGARGNPQPSRGGRGNLNLNMPLDATPGTFYSAMSNIDIEIGDGNAGAVGVRARYAQHCYLAHMEFRTGSGLAGIHDGGNEAEDLRFVGGQYGIITRKPSPGWQFTIVDAVFEGQKQGAIREHEAGLTLIHPTFRNVPSAIAIDDGYAEELWVKGGRFENISGPAVTISREQSVRTEINMENVVCDRVAQFALFRESGKKIAGPAAMYEVKSFSHGMHFSDMGAAGETRTNFDAAPLKSLPADQADLPELPARDTWVDIRALGVKGDGETDDTEAIRGAIAGHRTLYFPIGQYRVTDTIVLKPDTVLVGLHPGATAIVLKDGTPAFQGVGAAKAVIEAPQRGTNIVSGIGIYTNGVNPRATAMKWMAGEKSMVNDVRFLGGHGTNRPDGTRENPYNNTHTADPDLNRRWDGQYASLWVTAGGGGRFVNIWTPSTFAQAGLYVSDTSTEGRVYELSSEHHVRNEVVLRHVSNWHLYSVQTEEERGEGGFALPIEISDSQQITVANLHMYRVVSSFQPFPYAIKVTNSKDIRLRNIHCYSDSKVGFDSAVYDPTLNSELRQREFAWLTISGNPVRAAKTSLPVEKLAGGFYNISGGAVDPTGNYYFVDAQKQTIYRWDTAAHRLSTVADSPLDPVNLMFDKAGNLMVISYAGKGTVYTFRPGSAPGDVTLLKPEASAPRPGLTPILPVDHWRLENNFTDDVPVKKPYQFVSPDGTTFIPAGEDFISGRLYYGSKLHDVIRAFGLAAATPGKPFYVSDEGELETYRATIDESGTMSGLKLFAEAGGEGLAVDTQGNVYIAAGQIFVYNPAGQRIDTIEVPERPLQLVFGGSDQKTLFIAGRTSLYAVRVH